MIRAATLACMLVGLATMSVAAPSRASFHAVRVAREGVWHADPNGRQTPADCRRFRLSSAAAARWFAHARRVDKGYWLEQLDWTQCSAEGTLVGQDGRRRRWELDESGRGRVIFSPTRAVYLAGPELPFTR